ncbi:MAG: manganese efflux pump [Defluviitaleaceae bacterium]|nr:manganese efflux pump [Defluviitaleaceae bacterium]
MVASGLIVSVDAFFIGLSLGLQKKCKFLHLVIINVFLFGLCMLGFFIAERMYERIPFDTGLMVGIVFIAMGFWYIAQCFLFKRESRAIVPVGLVMSVEAMIITMGLTFIFGTAIVIPLTVAVAHFGYSVISFYLVRHRYVQKLPLALSHVISGLALIIYGVFALLF